MSQKRICSLLLCACLLASATACKSSQEDPDASSPQEETGTPVQTQTVSAGDISSQNKVSGKVEADDEHVVMVATNAKCTAVYVDAGDTVAAGQVLCTLDLESTLASYNAASISYQSTVENYNNQKNYFDTQIALTEKNVSDLKALYEIGAASQTEIDQAELQLLQLQNTRQSTLDQLEAGMESYRSNVEQLSTVLQDVDSQGNVLAPAAGTLVSLSAVENGFISASTPVAVIDGVDQMKITVSVSEALVPKLNLGDEAEVAVSSLGAAFTGSIRSIEKTANAQTKLYTVTVSVPADVAGLMSGMFAEVTFRTETSENTIVIPTEAILTSGSTQHVFVVEDNAAKYVEVTTGLTGNGVTEITSGLEAGDLLVTVGQSYLTDGDVVRVISGED